MRLTVEVTASGITSDAVTDEEADAMNAVMVEAGTPTEDPVDEGTPDVPEIIVEASGEFIDRSHPTEGRAR